MRAIWTLLSLMAIFTGLMTMIGWLAHVPILVQPISTFAALYFNPALCFVLAGAALLCVINPSPGSTAASIIIGLMLIFFAGITIFQDSFNVNFYIDQWFATAWLPEINPYPGRMSPSSAMGFILCGLIFILMPLGAKRWIGLIIEVSIFFLFIIAVEGLTGYALHLDFFYNWYSFTRISFQSTVLFLILGCVLWSYWRHSSLSQTMYEGRQETKIILLSAAILVSVTLIVSLASFVSLAKQEHNQIGQSFHQVLQQKSMIIETEVNHVVQLVSNIDGNVTFKKMMQESSGYSKLNVDDALKMFLAQGFSGVKINDQYGTTYASIGDFIQNPELKVEINTKPVPSTLMWRDGWYLQVTSNINPNNPLMGSIVVEWPLYNVDIALSNIVGIGKTGEILICVPEGDAVIACYNSRINKVYTVPRSAPRQFLPVDYSLAGQSGEITVSDTLRSRWFAVFSPIDNLGIGMIIRIDTTEIYGPITQNLKIILPVVLLAIIVGLLLLRLQVSPLVRRMVSAERELTKTNTRLQESEERYSVAVRGSHVGLWDWKVGTDEVFYSPYYKTMLGYVESDVPQTIDFFNKIIHPDDKGRVDELGKQHLEHYAPFEIEFRLKTKTGDYHWVHASGEAMRDINGVATRMAGSITDITERKKAEQRLAAQYAVIRVLSQSANLEESVEKIIKAISENLEWQVGIMWLVNYNLGVMYCVGLWHPSNVNMEDFEKITCDMELHLGDGLPGRVWKSAQPAYIFDISSDKNSGRFQEAARIGMHSSLCFPILLQNKVLGALEFFSIKKQIPDDSLVKMMSAMGNQVGQFIQRRSTEIALRDSEEYKTAILESASDSILTINANGKVVSYNRLTVETFGYQAAELSDISIDVLIPNIWESLAKTSDKHTMESQGRRQNGEFFPAEISMATMTLDEKFMYVCIIRDITERRKVEKLKNDFISVVSHELRTPLTSIRGALSLVLGGKAGSLSEKIEKLLSIAYKNCDRLLLLINDILDTDKIESGKMPYRMKIIDVDEIVREAISANKLYGEKFGVSIELTSDAVEAKVYADPDRLMQVITNLISNAVKFSPPGEMVAISTGVYEKFVRISVLDKGAGIPLDFQSKIFQKFSQADTVVSRAAGGTGLGLSISKAIIEKLGGTIKFASQPGHGALFYVDMPLYIEGVSTQVMEDEKSSPSKVQLLLCEDEQDQADFLSELLRASDYDVDIASDAEKAKNMLSNKAYSGLLLDLGLPHQDGISLIRELRNQGNDIPIIVVSVTAQEGKALVNGDPLAVVDWLDKPVDYRKLLQAIEMSAANSPNKIPQVLHVEDDKDAQRVIATLLTDRAIVTDVETLKEATEILQTQRFDLVILDLLLPDGNGTELLPQLAKQKIPVVVFSVVELDRDFGQYVRNAMVKSKISNEEFVRMISDVLKLQIKS